MSTGAGQMGLPRCTRSIRRTRRPPRRRLETSLVYWMPQAMCGRFPCHKTHSRGSHRPRRQSKGLPPQRRTLLLKIRRAR
jgi:hypothetical protein